MRQGNLFLGGEQRHPADFLQVETDRIIDIDQVEVDVELLGFGRLFIRGFLGIAILAEGAYVDALLKEVSKDVVELLDVAFRVGKHAQYIVIGDEALIAAQGE